MRGRGGGGGEGNGRRRGRSGVGMKRAEVSGEKFGLGCYGFQVTRGVGELGSGEVEHG